MGLRGGKKRSELPGRRLNADQAPQRSSEEMRGRKLFRRNRTLVGSLSHHVQSASELNGDLRSPRAHVHRLSAHRRLVTGALVAVVGVSCLLIWLLYEFTAGISVTATDSISIDEPRYQRAINSYFSEHPFERLRFALDTESLAAYLRQHVAEVSDASTSGADGFTSTQFDLTFRKPVASWLIGSRQYYVDENGVSFQTNYFDGPTVKIIDKSGVPQTAGTIIASSRFLRFVGRTVTLSKAVKLTITQAVIPASTTHQIEVTLAKHKYPAKLSLDRPVGEQVEDMARAVKYFDKHHMKPEYVDVRVSGKAYYR